MLQQNKFSPCVENRPDMENTNGSRNIGEEDTGVLCRQGRNNGDCLGDTSGRSQWSILNIIE